MTSGCLLFAQDATRAVFQWGRIESNADWILPIIACAGIAVFVRYMYGRDARELSPVVGRLLTGLRIAVFLGLLVLYLQPEWRSQREVVRNERRQTSENTPYGKVELRLPELLYPEGHPYHHPVIGSHADLEAATVTDVKEFFARHYDPANASLVVAGDFDPNKAKATIERWFGTIPSRGAPADPGAPGFSDAKTTLTSVVRETIEDDVELPNEWKKTPWLQSLTFAYTNRTRALSSAKAGPGR